MKYNVCKSIAISSVILLASCSNMQTSSTSELLTDVAEQTSTTSSVIKQPSIVSFKNVTLTQLDLNQTGNEVTVKPGRIIHAKVHYKYQCNQCDKTLNNQIIVGLANRSAQACIYDGGTQGEGIAEFKLKAPAKPGKYDVRFRGLQAVDCNAALKAGWRADDSPPKSTTIGVITASRKA
jgi:hypothetical protein